MASSLSPADILQRDREAAQRLVLGVGQQKTQAILRRAQLQLQQRLKTAGGLSGPGKESFTYQQLRATLAQVRAVTAHLQVGMQGVVIEQGQKAAEQAATLAAKYLHIAEQHFTGSTERLNLDSARLVDRAVAGTESSLLQRLMHGPDTKKGQGILQRYGQNVVDHFEDHLQQRLVARTPWAEVRQQLTDESPFLQAAPAHWAERIVRTETMFAEGRSSNQAIGEADQQLGDMCKIISSVFDDRTGSDSISVHGEIRRPAESFQSWFGSYQHPPDRPNDRSVVVPHRISWPIPAELKPKGYGAVAARWSKEGRKGAPPPSPLMTTIPLDSFGKPPPPMSQPEGAPQSPGDVVLPLTRPVDRRVSAQVPGDLRSRWPAEPPELFTPPTVPFSPIAKQISPQAGSNPGGVYEGTDEVQRYVKFYKDPAQAVGEHLANSLYGDLGIQPKLNSLTFEHEGKLAYASELLPNTTTLGKKLQTLKPAAQAKLAKKALEGFAADVLMANWDAAGLDLDNMLVGPDGSITRIDNGASFLTRAQGARKPTHQLNNPTEWAGFFDPTKNPAYAKLAKMAGVSGPADLAPTIKKGVKQILKVRDAAGGWQKYVDARAAGLSVSDRDAIVQMLDKRTIFLEQASIQVSKEVAAAKPLKSKAVKTGPGAPIEEHEVKAGKAAYNKKLPDATRFLQSHQHLEDLQKYTGANYRQINRSLAGLHDGASPADIGNRLLSAERINTVLASAKAAGLNVEGTVLRGFKGSLGTIKAFMERDEHTLAGFTSTTTSERVARNFAASDHPVFLRIRQRSAIPIDSVSRCQGEFEALLPAGTKIRILKRWTEVRGGKTWLNVDAEEL